jgi:hypothetical protein
MKFLHFIFLLAVTAEIGVPAILGVPMVNTELDRGIAMANVAATSQSVFYAQAEKVYVQVKTLLPKISGLTWDDHTALRTRVTDLRMALELVPGAMERGLAPSNSAAPQTNL